MRVQFRHSRSALRGYRLYSRFASALLFMTGLCNVLAWVWGLDLLPDSGNRRMRLMAAFCFILSGIALACAGRETRLSHRLSTLLCVVLICLGVEALMEHAVPGYRGLSDLIDTVSAGRPSSLMTELAAFSFLLLGGQGLLLMTGRALMLRELCALGVLTIAMASMASFAFVLAQPEAGLLNRFPAMTGALLLFATLGWMAVDPTKGLARISTAASMGGVFARVLLLPALLLPLMYAFVFKMLETRFGVSPILASTLGSVFTGGSVAWMIWLVATLLDRSERQRAMALKLSNEAGTDALTGLGNRRQMDAALSGLLEDYRQQKQPFVLLLLDVDHFKAYNDSHGHPAGDAALQGLADVLRSTLRPQDLAVRQGGEEFAVLMPGIDIAQARVAAERILLAIRTHDWPFTPLTASIGCTEVQAGDTMRLLFQRADIALYRAKHNGRDRFEVTEPSADALDAAPTAFTTEIGAGCGQ